MKKSLAYLCSSIMVFPLMGSGIPNQVQVPSSFFPQTITTNTSRYFLQRVPCYYPGINEVYAFSLYNAGARVARISAIGCETHYATAAEYFTLSCYKNGITTGTNYTPINDSTLQISVNGYFASGTDEVYTLQAVGAIGAVRGFEYIPKELYSVIIAPGETLTITLNSRGSAQYSALIMWEEIVN